MWQIIVYSLKIGDVEFYFYTLARFKENSKSLSFINLFTLAQILIDF